jgi:hypothetical protein
MGKTMHAALAAGSLGALLVGCGTESETTSGESAPAAAEASAETGAPPLIGGFVDGEPVNYLLTDVSDEKEAQGLSEATGFPVTFVPSLAEVPDSALANLYLFMNGVEGPNPFGFQANVLDTVPGDEGYSPLWRVHAVTWADEAAATELRSEEDILAAEEAGELTVEETPLVKNSPVVPS